MKLTKRQLNTLEKHKKTHGHTKKHMDFMTKKMMDGSTFSQAHKLAMKKIGK